MHQPLMVIKKSRSSDDNMIPMINIVFLLLIFFMVAGQIRGPQGNILLPEVNTKNPLVEQDIVLQIDKDKHLLLNGKPVAINALSSKLESLHAAHVNVSLKADRRILAADLDTVFKVLRTNGVTKTTLYAEKKVAD